jgi:prepilin-type N-terminal cleavage/methylation domain-containing protein
MLISKRFGFTLIEVLVVVAIMALLTAIILPSFAEARRISKKTVCLHNLQQISTAIQSYLHNNRDTFPPDIARTPTVGAAMVPPKRPLPKVLQRELAGTGNKNAEFVNKVFECPADTITIPAMMADPTIGGKGPRYFDSQKTSYEWNEELNGKMMHYKTVKIFKDMFSVPPDKLEMVKDFETSFHGPANRKGSQNILFADFEPRSQ